MQLIVAPTRMLSNKYDISLMVGDYRFRRADRFLLSVNETFLLLDIVFSLTIRGDRG